MAWVRCGGGTPKTLLGGSVTVTFGRPIGGYTYMDAVVTLGGNTIFSERLTGNALPSTITRTFTNSGYTYTITLYVGSSNNGRGHIEIAKGSDISLDTDTTEFINTPFTESFSYLISV